MSHQSDENDDEDFFKEVYGSGYRGPMDSRENRSAPKTSEKPNSLKRESEANISDEEWGPRDPNELPTDFTTREAKLWDAKAKAAERHWKRKKEEELICSVCGEYGHFAQGCPSTLGGASASASSFRSSDDRQPIVHKSQFADRRLKSRIIGSGGSVIQGIEKNCRCKVRLEDNVGPAESGFTAVITGYNEKRVKRAAESIAAIAQQAEAEWKQQQEGRRGGAAGRGGGIPSPSFQGKDAAGQWRGGRGAGAYQRGFTVPTTGIQTLNPVSSGNWEPPPQSGKMAPSTGKEGSGNVQGLDPSMQYGGYGVSSQDAQSVGQQFYQSGAASVTGYGNIPTQNAQMPTNAVAAPPAIGGQLLGQGVALEKKQTLQELQEHFLAQTVALTKAQTAAEKEEEGRHTKRLEEIRGEYQMKAELLRAQQAKELKSFTEKQSQLMAATIPQETVYSNQFEPPLAHHAAPVASGQNYAAREQGTVEENQMRFQYAEGAYSQNEQAYYGGNEASGYGGGQWAGSAGYGNGGLDQSGSEYGGTYPASTASGDGAFVGDAQPGGPHDLQSSYAGWQYNQYSNQPPMK